MAFVVTAMCSPYARVQYYQTLSLKLTILSIKKYTILYYKIYLSKTILQLFLLDLAAFSTPLTIDAFVDNDYDVVILTRKQT